MCHMEETEKTEKPVEEEIKWFQCYVCGMKEEYHFKEKKPKALRGIIFKDDSYVMKDPFTPPEKRQFLVLGSDCCICKKPVCQAPECSVFYQERYCQSCAWQKKKTFPEQILSKIKDPSND